MALIPIYWWTKEVHHFHLSQKRFVKRPWANGVILLSCVVLAMLLANLPFTKGAYQGFLHTEFTIHLASPGGLIDWFFPRGMTMEKFINDILMVLFFFTVGLEIKREIVCGELSSFRKAILPVIAAFGGVLLPALIFTLVNRGTAAASGWGIPTATDIAFAVCILSVLGDKVPVSLKVFLTALAIADDLIAILVVAIFYGGSINIPLLLIAVLVILLTLGLRRLGEKRMFPYLLMAFLVWVLFYYSGIHATMSGVVMAFLIPAKPIYNKSQYYHKRNRYIKLLDQYAGIDGDSEFPNGPQKHCLRKLHAVAQGSMDMSYRVEHALNPWVNFVIMPIFALANAGVVISGPEISSVSIGIFLGLVLGKPLGITLASLLAIKTGAGEMPEKATWPMFFAVACLGGIGFTMSIFVDTLSFSDQAPEIAARMRDMGKIAVLVGSICAGVLGSVLINIVHKVQSSRK